MNKTSSLAKGFQSTSLPIYGEQIGQKTPGKRRCFFGPLRFPFMGSRVDQNPLAREDGIKLLQFFFKSCAVSGAIYNIQRNKMQIDVTLITGILDQKYIFLIAI